jgi:tRNA pseudouridine55 synthase
MRHKFPVHGILLLDKPEGMSSNHALQRVKRLFQAEKAGHAGTLDPMATGILPVLFGEASKFAQAGLDAQKSYEAVMKLGVATTTGDATGEVLVTQAIPQLTAEQLLSVQKKFHGAQKQIPPMYSALKKDGVPLYRLARQGEVVERAVRDLTIYALSLTQIDPQHLLLRVTCSKGTYIRTLAEDLACALNTVAHLVSLRRTAVGRLTEPLYTLSALTAQAEQTQSLSPLLLPIDGLLYDLPRWQLSENDAHALFQGKKIACVTSQPRPDLLNQNLRVYTECGFFCGIGVFNSDYYLSAKRLVAQTQWSAKQRCD